MIQIEGVSKYFDTRAAVDGLDLAVPAGCLFGLIGPNGAGKTTTLKMLATLVKPDAGRLAIDGIDVVEDPRAVRRRVGYMPDAFGTFKGLTCKEYLQFFGRAHGIAAPQLRTRITDILDLTDLGPRRDELISTLSTGLRQRLSLAKTLLHDPAVLLLDEPASGLDPRARIEIRALLGELKNMGKTIIISSHILVDLEEICTDIGIIEEGQVVWHGPIAAVPDAGAGEVRALRVEIPPGDRERAVALLGALPYVVRVQGNEGRIDVALSEHHGNELLAALIAEDIEIRSFAPERRDLEALFLARTKGLRS